MDEIINSIREVAEETAEGLFPENQMGWLKERTNFVATFIKDFENTYYTKKAIQK
ncbi:MAG: hypothetical protein WCK67_08005 [bacterium]